MFVLAPINGRWIICVRFLIKAFWIFCLAKKFVEQIHIPKSYRSPFIILVRDLRRLPNECLYILGLWLWLEHAGFYNFISNVLRLLTFLIDEVVDEAMTFFGSLNAQFPPLLNQLRSH
ncbi:hypothetical protein ACS0TY_013222 [Phlomoides rotata]